MPSNLRSRAAIAHRLSQRVVLCSLFLAFATSAVAQPPYFTPARPDEQHGPQQIQASPKDQLRPETNTRRSLSAARVEQEIQKRINSNPAMATANVTARVDTQSVVLNGTVDSSRQHDLALLIAHSWAGQRKIVDHIKRRM